MHCILIFFLMFHLVPCNAQISGIVIVFFKGELKLVS